MKEQAIPQYEPAPIPGLPDALHRYASSGGWLTEHEQTREFERAIAHYVGSKHCVVTTSGTMALTLAGMALGIGPGGRVIVPAYSMIATGNAFRALGAGIRFVDVEPQTLCMLGPDIEDALRLDTEAVILVSANGRLPTETWSMRGPPVIEDACQAMGSRYPDGRYVGTAGAIGCYSFSPHKIVSTGQGGACVTNDDDLADKLRRAKDFGRSSGGADVHPHFGINAKFTDLQAVVGLAQMGRLAERTIRKRQIAIEYAIRLTDVPQVQLYGMQNDAVPWMVDGLFHLRDELQDYLSARGIGTRKMYPPIPHQECYVHPGRWPVAEDAGRRGMWLPSSMHITDAQIDEVCSAVREFYR